MFGRVLGLGVIVFALLAAPSAHAAVTGNLLVNGDAEAHRCTRDFTAETTTPGWRVTRGAVSVLCYAAFAAVGETPALPPGAPGDALFSAPGADAAMEQSVDVSAAAAAIDDWRVSYRLSGWLGGWKAMPDRATLTLTFLDARGEAAGAPVEIVDGGPQARGGVSALVARERGGRVPPGTRKLVVTVSFLQSLYSFQDAFADNLSLTLNGEVSGLAPAALAAPPSDVPALDHVFVVMMENTNYADVFHTSGRTVSVDAHMPFLASLAPSGVILSNFSGTYHPSDQNYVAMVAGDTFRFGPVYYPDYKLAARHIGDLIDARRKSWRAYVQHMREPCNLKSVGQYSPDDEPFVQFTDVTGDAPRCTQDLRPLEDFEAAVGKGDLPDYAWFAADNWWDGEGAWFVDFNVAFSLARQDQFLQQTFAPLLQSDAWLHSKSLLVITWDETDGWGWQDNRVPTLVVGSPGLLRAGAVVGRRYDGYGVLRTSELALGLPNLGRFDAYAEPLNAIFRDRPAGARDDDDDLQPVESAATRGSLAQTFGRASTGAGVVAGQRIGFVGPADPEAALAVAPLGSAPGPDSPRYRFDPASGIAYALTADLAPGFYGAWVVRGGRPPARAARPFQILPAPGVTASSPGVEIVGAPAGAETREGANFAVRYCRPANLPAASAWIGLFPKGTPAAQMTKANENQISNWLRAPDVGDAPCGEAWAYPAELAPNVDYEAILFQDAPGGAIPVGARAAFRVTKALP